MTIHDCTHLALVQHRRRSVGIVEPLGNDPSTTCGGRVQHASAGLKMLEVAEGAGVELSSSSESCCLRSDIALIADPCLQIQQIEGEEGQFRRLVSTARLQIREARHAMRIECHYFTIDDAIRQGVGGARLPGIRCPVQALRVSSRALPPWTRTCKR